MWAAQDVSACMAAPATGAMHAGLDSATLESVITTLANLTHSLRLTTVIGLLQPPPELFDIFDDVLLLSEGHVVYHVRSQAPRRAMRAEAALLVFPGHGVG